MDVFPQGCDCLPTTRIPLCTILRYPFLPKTFLKAPSAPIYVNFGVGARTEKMQFFGQNLGQKFRRRKLGQNGLFSVLGELEKSIRST